MPDPNQALQTQLANIEKRSGKSREQLGQLLTATGLRKHGELRDWLKRELGLGHGDANMLVQMVGPLAAVAPAAGVNPLDAIYDGPKAALRPIHDALMAAIAGFGDFELAPKKTYISLRRKKQFAMIGPATRTQVEVGINAKGLRGGTRLVEVPAGGMCNYKVRIGSVAEADVEMVAWLRKAFDAAG